jgi:transcriptional antiterminator RfaH
MDFRVDAIWYVVQTKPRQESRALENLSNQGFEAYYPKVSVERSRRGRLSWVIEPLFSRYLFLRAQDPLRDYSAVRSTKGVSHLLKFGTLMATISHTMVQTMREQGEVMIKRQITKGQAVVMVDGPLKGLSGVYVQEDGERRSLILLELLSRPLQVSVERQNYAPV